MVKGDRLQICYLQVQILSLSQNLEVLSNWLARQTVNLVPKGLVGSSPTTSTIGIYSVIGNIVDFQSIVSSSSLDRCSYKIRL